MNIFGSFSLYLLQKTEQLKILFSNLYKKKDYDFINRFSRVVGLSLLHENYIEENRRSSFEDCSFVSCFRMNGRPEEYG